MAAKKASKKVSKSYFNVGDKVCITPGTLKGRVTAKRHRESDDRWFYSVYTTEGLDVHNLDEVRLYQDKKW